VDLINFVRQPTWRELLLEAVATEKMDPWSIDILAVTQTFIKKVKAMKEADLKIPAAVLLAASILLRLKAELLGFQEDIAPEQFTEPEPVEPMALEEPQLVLRTRLPPKRQVTLDELMEAVETAIERAERPAPERQAPPLSVELPPTDISKQIEDVLTRVKSKADGEGLLTYSDLLKKQTSEEKLYVLMPLLHLTQERKLNIWQDKFFGEIFVKVIAE